MPIPFSRLELAVQKAVDETPIFDMHTHLYPPAFDGLLLWGIDELLTYHYLIAEVIRATSIPAEDFWQMDKAQQADFIWNELFIKRAPVSEACRGVITVMRNVGLDPSDRDLKAAREFYKTQTVDEFIELVFTKANVHSAVMTNDPFDKSEVKFWETIGNNHPRLHAALRIDPMLLWWDVASETIEEQGYEVDHALNEKTFCAARKFLEDWAAKMKPRYMAVSLPPTFTYPADDVTTQILDSVVLPFAREAGLPFALMIGVKRSVNPNLKLAGDGVGRADLSCLEQLCQRNPENKFFATLLSRENQHELCILARKFSNLMPFGCWWFMNNPSVIEEITRERIETLGWSFIPQHSDARVLDQLLYKWPHSRRIIAQVLVDKYQDMVDAGWRVMESEIYRDVNRLFSQNFEEFAPNWT
ncbi:MAG: glucuronate isomerase [bacterium]|nr:glucuronate isomerase [bacterium]